MFEIGLETAVFFELAKANRILPCENWVFALPLLAFIVDIAIVGKSAKGYQDYIEIDALASNRNRNRNSYIR